MIRGERVRRTADRAADVLAAIILLVSGFIISAALLGLWLGLVWRFVWVTAP